MGNIWKNNHTLRMLIVNLSRETLRAFFHFKLLTHNNVILWFLLMERGDVRTPGTRYDLNNTPS